MQRFLYLFAFLVVLLLDYAALDDITTGNEPSLWGEYLILGLSAPIFTGCLERSKK